MNVMLVGYGYWGKNIARVFHQDPNFCLHTICDNNTNALNKAKLIYKDLNLINSIEDTPKEIDLVAIITPVKSHYSLAKYFLEKNKSVLLTKPFVETYQQALELYGLAETKNKILFVDYTFLFHPAVHKLKSMIDEIGKPFLVFGQRMNLGLYQPASNVIYDLAPHDLSILHYIFEDILIDKINVQKSKLANLPQEDFANVHMHLSNGVECNLSFSWLSPFKIRQFLIIGSKGMLLYDDVLVTDKIKFFDTSITLKELSNMGNESPLSYTARIEYKTGNTFSPAIPSTEALSNELRELYKVFSSLDLREHYKKINLKIMRNLEAVN